MGDRVLIIAEAGVCHNGYWGDAWEMAEMALEAGADVVKYQTFWDLPDLPHISAFDLKRLELTENEWIHLKKHCDDIGIEFMSTPDTVEAVEFLADIGMKRWKISHRGIYDSDLVNAVIRQGGELFVSATSRDKGAEFISATCHLLCSDKYPSACSDYNLRLLGTRFQGISDHTPGIALPIAAAARGASIIEKHFTLDRTQPGPDHHFALEPDELAEMVRGIRCVEEVL